MGIPSTGDRSDAQSYMLRKLEAKYKDSIQLVYPEDCVHRIFHDFARNEIVEDFLKSDCDILFFLDSDIVPPPRYFDLITKCFDEWNVAGAAYPVFMDGKLVFTVYNYDSVRDCMHIIDAPRTATSKIEWVDGLATGCMMIKRKVFVEMQKPYFEFKYKPESRELCEGEDLGFCKKLMKLKYKTLTDFSQVGKHYKRVDLLDISNYTIDYANSKVLEYDAEIRPQFDHLLQKLRGKTTPHSNIIKPKFVLP